jgi:Tfp pilus assembly pilus retraction ATPase PilT
MDAAPAGQRRYGVVALAREDGPDPARMGPGLEASRRGWMAPMRLRRLARPGEMPRATGSVATMDIAELLAFSVKNKASDLHLSAGLPPMIRVDGDVRRINIPALDHKQVHALVYDIMSDKQRRDYEEFLEVDFSFEIPGLARFRVNAFNQNRGAGAVFRTVPSEVLTLEDLGCPKIFQELIDQPQGLILVTGPTGSGKSTTLAAMHDHFNKIQ